MSGSINNNSWFSSGFAKKYLVRSLPNQSSYYALIVFQYIEIANENQDISYTCSVPDCFLLLSKTITNRYVPEYIPRYLS
jgi:hypothetical protein